MGQDFAMNSGLTANLVAPVAVLSGKIVKKFVSRLHNTCRFDAATGGDGCGDAAWW